MQNQPDFVLIQQMLEMLGDHLGVFKIEEVETVMRRTFVRSDGETAELIDFYPKWNAAGSYGAYKLASQYMDQEWQIKSFERVSGLSYQSLPVYEAGQALKRVKSRPHRCEVAVQRPFKLFLKPQKGEETNDKTIIVRYLPMAQQPTQPRHQQPAAPASPPMPDEPPATPPAPPAPPKPQPSQPSALTAEEWLEQASAATNDFDLDTCMSRAYQVFATADNVAKTRQLLFGDWVNGRAVAYTAGLRAYAETRAKLQEQGKAVPAAHAGAKTEAMNAYHKALEALQYA